MQQQLNTPEELRAIREAMDEGKNPLVATDVPRWEDQVGISRIVNRRVLEFEVLPTPAQVLGDLPLSDQAQEIVAYSRDEIRACLYGQDDRLLVIVGPCSVHDPAAALDYARRLAALKDELGGELLIVMRVYFEKPRTTVGWKGLINDPDIDGSCNIKKGLLLAVEDLGDGVGVHVQGLALAGDAVEVEDHGDRGDVDRDVEGVAGSAHALGLLDLVIGQGGIGAGPCGGAGQEGGNASAGTRRVVGDLGIRVGALEAGDPGFHSSLLGGSASAGEVAGHGFGGLGVGASRRISVGSSVVAASRDRSQHHNAGHSCNGAYENGITHYSFPSVNILMAYVSDISYAVVAIVLHDTVKPIGGLGPAKPKSVNGR